MPADLPKSLPLTGRLQRRLEDAAVAIGRLDGRAQELPNPQLLARPAIREEAVSTSALEGTYSTPPQLEEDELDRAAREVRNYVWAAEHAYRRILGEGHPLTLRLIRELRGILMDGTGGSPSDVAQFRNRQNWIRPRRNSTILESTFVPLPPESI